MIFLMIFWFMLPAFIFVLLFLVIQKVDHPVSRKINHAIDTALEWRKRHGRPVPEMLFIACMALGLFLAAKMINSQAVWNEGEIHIFWNEATKQQYQYVIHKHFGERIRTPQSEPVYFPCPHGMVQTDPAFQFKFLVFFISSDDIKQLPDKLRMRVLNKKKQQVHDVYDNVWVRNQRVYVVFLDNLKSIRNAGSVFEELCHVIKQDIDLEIKKGLFKHRDVKKRQHAMLNTFGWTFLTMADFEVRIDDSNDGFVSLSPKTGNRWVNIRWVDNADSSWLNVEWVVQQRNNFGQTYYNGTLIEDIHLTSRSANFLRLPAIEVQGLWGNEKRSIGGPFKSICFYDSAMKRIYLVDYAVHASGMRKMPYLRRMKLVAQSFRTHRSLLNISNQIQL